MLVYQKTQVFLHEVHGNIRELRCLKCNKDKVDGSEHLNCCEFVIPNIVLFGENTKRIHEMWYFAKRSNYIVTIGTESSFEYILHAIKLCKQRDGMHIDINTKQTNLSLMSNKYLKMNAIDGLHELNKILI